MACRALLLTATLLVVGGGASALVPPPRPHIVLIVVDDMGYHNLRAPPLHRNAEISSPTLTRMVRACWADFFHFLSWTCA